MTPSQKYTTNEKNAQDNAKKGFSHNKQLQTQRAPSRCAPTHEYARDTNTRDTRYEQIKSNFCVLPGQAAPDQNNRVSNINTAGGLDTQTRITTAPYARWDKSAGRGILVRKHAFFLCSRRTFSVSRRNKHAVSISTTRPLATRDFLRSNRSN